MKFTIKFLGNKLVAQSESGEILASFQKTMRSTPRDSSNSYDAHRIAKGDRFQTSSSFIEEGRVDEVLVAVERQLPRAFEDAKWTLDKRVYPQIDYEFQMPEFRRYEFLRGVAGGCAWFGNTDKKVVAAVKRAQKNLAFDL